MPDAFTDNFSFTLPEIGGSTDTWGDKINQNWAMIDQLLQERLDTLNAAIQNASDQAAARSNSLIGFTGYWPAGNGALPSNMLVTKGQTVSREAYPILFQRIGTRYNNEDDDDDTLFRLPAGQDRYVRGTVDGNDTGLGELLDDTFRAHNHDASSAGAGSHNHTGTTQAAGQHNHSGTTSSNGQHDHRIRVDGEGSPGWALRHGDRTGYTNDPTSFTEAAGNHNHTFTTSQQAAHTHGFTTSTQANHTHAITVQNTGGDETRPKTIRYLPVIICDWT